MDRQPWTVDRGLWTADRGLWTVDLFIPEFYSYIHFRLKCHPHIPLVWRHQIMELPSGKELLPQEDHVILYNRVLNFQTMPENDLWELFKGDTKAFNHVYSRYFPILYHYGHQFTKDHELVKDVIQDLFIYLKEKSRKLGKTTSIKFYLYKAYRRRIRRYLKRNKRDSRAADFDNAGFEVALPHESNIISSAIDEELKQKLEHAFAVLTRRQREIIMYYFFEGFSYKQITSVMGFAKVQYARILMSRTIARLRKELGGGKVIFQALPPSPTPR